MAIKKADKAASISCDPGGIQTHDLQNRNLTFYSAELRGHLGVGVGVGVGVSVSVSVSVGVGKSKSKSIGKSIGKSMSKSLGKSVGMNSELLLKFKTIRNRNVKV